MENVQKTDGLDFAVVRFIDDLIVSLCGTAKDIRPLNDDLVEAKCGPSFSPAVILNQGSKEDMLQCLKEIKRIDDIFFKYKKLSSVYEDLSGPIFVDKGCQTEKIEEVFTPTKPVQNWKVGSDSEITRIKEEFSNFDSEFDSVCLKEENAITITENDYFCYYCQEVRSSLRDLRKHIRSEHLEHDGSLRYSKDELQPTFVGIKEETLSNIPDLHTYGEGNPELRNLLSGGMSVALNRRISPVPSSQGHPFTCPCCGYDRYLKPGSISDNSANSEIDTCLNCGYCESLASNYFTTSNNLEKKPFGCPHCIFSASKEALLKQHIMRRHSENKPYPCSHCDYSTTKPYLLKQHVMSRHSNEKPHSCPHCKYSSVRPGEMKKHILLKHTGEKAHACSECGYRAARSWDLKKHVLNRHVKARPYACSLCPYTAFALDSLNVHVSSKHTNDRPHSCPFCDYRAVKERYIKQHIIAVHTKDKPFACSYCNYSAIRAGLLKNHIRARHP